MDDFNVSSLHESKNEWGARLLTILTPKIVEGFYVIFNEAHKLCKDNHETEKYLMTFQNFLARIPKWSNATIEEETQRIIKTTGCTYLEELVTCTHIIQLKLLTAMRVGQKQKKIDISIPKLSEFIHKCYINSARKIYKNVYLFEANCAPLQIQRHSRELEIIIQECILNAVRDSIPVESILKAYMDETVEEDVIEEIKEQIIESPEKSEKQGQVISETGPSKSPSPNSNPSSTNNNTESQSLKFNDIDSVLSKNGKEELVEAPKTIERLEEISALRNMQRKMEEAAEADDEILKISDENVSLDILDIHNIEQPDPFKLSTEMLLDEIEVLA